MISILDIHTHRPWYPENIPVCRIENIHQETPEIEGSQTISVGLHPWFVKDNWRQEWERIWEHAQRHRIVAIGEAGLDRVCDADWNLQQEVFQHQIEIANQHDLPMIIHCVRAFPETIQALQKAKPPVVFHGFSGKYSRIESAIDSGFLVSFGMAILNPKSSARHAFSQMPINQILLETDGEHVSIESIYEAAAEIRGLSMEELQEKILLNAIKVFPELCKT